ncbi:MAG TPA: hypothetical protein PLR22_06360, partial [Saprospiraceae bacterium]|nr:hypothetical protein [Saprospiraceae bacterium]
MAYAFQASMYSIIDKAITTKKSNKKGCLKDSLIISNLSSVSIIAPILMRRSFRLGLQYFGRQFEFTGFPIDIQQLNTYV